MFGRRKREGSVPAPAAPPSVPDLLAGRRGGPQPVLTGMSPSHPPQLDVLSNLSEDWGRSQALLGYAARVRCDQSDAGGWEFRRAAEYDPEASRRLDEDDTTLQVVALRGYCSSFSLWDLVRNQYRELRHEDFDRLGDARFTGIDHTNSPVCVFRVGQLVVRVRMTGTLAQRQYTRVYALDIAQHIDYPALEAWSRQAKVLL